MSELKPKAYLHIMDNTEGIEGNIAHSALTLEPDHPFGIAGTDYDDSFPVTTTPLFTRPNDAKLQEKYDKLKERVEGADKYWAYDSTKGSHNPKLLKTESSVRKEVRRHLAENPRQIALVELTPEEMEKS